MHRLELDIGRMARAFVLTCFCLLMVVPTISVQAQQPTPPPAPTLSPGAQTIIQTTTDAIDRYGILNVAMFVLLIAVVVIAVIAARSFIVPLINSNSTGNQQLILLVQQIASISQQGFKAQQDTAVAIQRMADAADRGTTVDERMAVVLNTLESKHDAHEDRVMQAKQINEYADQVIAPVKEVVDNTLESVKGIENKLDTLMTHEDFTEEIAKQLQPVRDDIAELRKTIEDRLLPTIEAVEAQPPEPVKDEPPTTPPVTPKPIE